MTMASSNKNDPFKSSSRNGGTSFEEHNQRMRAFYRTHARQWRQWVEEVPKAPKKATTPLLRQLSRKG